MVIWDLHQRRRRQTTDDDDDDIGDNDERLTLTEIWD